MAQKESLSCLAKRDLLNQTAVPVEKLLSWGNQYEQSGMLHDAVNFYEKAKATDALHSLLKIVQEEGDTFLFKRINRILNRVPDRSEWLALAHQAERLGKEAFAAEAFREVDKEGVQKQTSANP